MERQYTPEKQKQIPNKEMINVTSAPENKEQKKTEDIKQETSEITEIKEEKKKEEKKEKPRRTEAMVFGKDLGISTKNSIAICKAIRGKKAEEAIHLLEQVVNMKRAIPMKQEIGHRHGRMMSGRWPVKASKQFIKLLKQLIANATVVGVEIEKARIECKANLASRPYKRGGSEKFKRTHIILKLKELSFEKKPRKENEKK